MATAEAIAAEIRGLTVHLLDAAITRDYHWPTTRRHRSMATVSFDNDQYIADAMKLGAYTRVYAHLAGGRAYNIMMLDGAIVQFMYRFERRRLTGHRLAYLPAADTRQLHDVFGKYGDGHLTAVPDRRAVPVPLRVDYDVSDGRHRPRTHPKCHLTLGEHRSCRIPVSSPLTPCRFMDFLLRSFYDDGERGYANRLPKSRCQFLASIHTEERQIVHVVVPG